VPPDDVEGLDADHGPTLSNLASCDRTTSEMRGLSPKIISGDSQ
jgi:hypothetical protein